MKVLFRTMAVAMLAGFLSACSPVMMLNLLVSEQGYHIERDLSYGTDLRQKLDLYVPDHLATPAPVLLFFYGGSWQGGSKAYYKALGQAFASRGMIVAVADYRVYPQVRYPAFIEDGANVFAFLQEHVAAHGGDPARIFISGHSAGAYIAMMLAADPRYLRAAGSDPGRVRGVIGIAGPYDFLPLQDEELIAIFGGANRPQTQPITYIDGKRPPMLLTYGADDTTVLPRNTLSLAARLRSFHSPVEVKSYAGTGHIGIILSLAPGFRGRTTLRQDIFDFVTVSRN